MRTPGLIAFLCVALTACGNEVLDSYPFPDGSVTFTHLPIDPANVRSFVPMGAANVQPKDHGGFPLRHAYRFPAATPVYAVRDGVIFEVRHGTREVPQIEDAPQNLWGRTYEDWALRLKVSKAVTVNYAHVTELHPDVLARIGNIPRNEEPREVGVEVKGGQIIGYVDPHGAMDFSVTDRTLRLSFENPGRYPKDHIYAGDVTAYYEGALQQQLLAITMRTAPPWGGKIDYDVRGRIVGNWFREGTSSYTQWSRQLAIVYDHIEAHRIFIADGSPMRDVPGIDGPGRPDIWWIKGNAPKPETIGQADGLVKYELILPDPRFTDPPVAGVMLVQMTAPGTIRVEMFPGQTAGQVTGFTAAARNYVR